MINTFGLIRVLELLQTDLSIGAVGDGTAPPVGATQLTSETFRKSIGDSVIDGTTLIKDLFLSENEANGTITEIGLLGDGATTTAGTGALFMSAGVNLTKTNTQSLTISFEIEVVEVI